MSISYWTCRHPSKDRFRAKDKAKAVAHVILTNHIVGLGLSFIMMDGFKKYDKEIEPDVILRAREIVKESAEAKS